MITILEDSKEILPQILFIIVLFINLLGSFTDQDRNTPASLIVTAILLGLTYWGGFYKSVFDILNWG